MATFKSWDDELVTCPYNQAHRMKKSRFQIHIVNCRKQHPDTNLVICPFDAKHHIPKKDYEKHLMSCRHRSIVENKVAIDPSSIERGNLLMPVYNGADDIIPTESWEEEFITDLDIERSLLDGDEKLSVHSQISERVGTANGKDESHVKEAELLMKSRCSSDSKLDGEGSTTSSYLGLSRGKPGNVRIAANIFCDNNSVKSGRDIILGIGRGMRHDASFTT